MRKSERPKKIRSDVNTKQGAAWKRSEKREKILFGSFLFWLIKAGQEQHSPGIRMLSLQYFYYRRFPANFFRHDWFYWRQDDKSESAKGKHENNKSSLWNFETIGNRDRGKQVGNESLWARSHQTRQIHQPPWRTLLNCSTFEELFSKKSYYWFVKKHKVIIRSYLRTLLAMISLTWGDKGGWYQPKS